MKIRLGSFTTIIPLVLILIFLLITGCQALEKGSGKLKTEAFNLNDFSAIEVKDDSGRVRKLECSERYYVPSEMTWLLKSAGFGTVDIFGCPLGAFSRGNPLTTDDFEMLIVAEKK